MKNRNREMDRVMRVFKSKGAVIKWYSDGFSWCFTPNPMNKEQTKND